MPRGVYDRSKTNKKTEGPKKAASTSKKSPTNKTTTRKITSDKRSASSISNSTGYVEVRGRRFEEFQLLLGYQASLNDLHRSGYSVARLIENNLARLDKFAEDFSGGSGGTSGGGEEHNDEGFTSQQPAPVTGKTIVPQQPAPFVPASAPQA